MPILSFILLIEWKFDFQTLDSRVLSAFTAIIGFVLALYFQWWRNRRRFSYKILSDVQLVSKEEEIRDKIEIRFEGEVVKNIRLIVIKLINDGYQPIKKDDFEKPIKILFPKAKILLAEKVELHPDNLSTEITHGDEWVQVESVLFNRKDFVQLKILVSKYENLKIEARIVGITKVSQVRRSIFAVAAISALAFGFTLGFVLGEFGKYEVGAKLGLILIVVELVAITVGIFGLFQLLQHAKRNENSN